MKDNVQVVRDVFAAFGRGDPATIVASVSQDVDWRHPGGPEVPYAGAYTGREGVSRFFARIGESVEVTRWEPRHVLAAGRDEVVATGTWSGVAKPTGKSFASDWGMVFGLRDGRITSFRVVEDTAQLAAAFRR
jgi:ketosteroid isomerase-like protein